MPAVGLPLFTEGGRLPAYLLATCSGLSSFCSLFGLLKRVTPPVPPRLTCPSLLPHSWALQVIVYVFVSLISSSVSFFSVLSVFQSHVFLLPSSLILLVRSSKPWSVHFLYVVDWKIQLSSSDWAHIPVPCLQLLVRHFHLKIWLSSCTWCQNWWLFPLCFLTLLATLALSPVTTLPGVRAQVSCSQVMVWWHCEGALAGHFTEGILCSPFSILFLYCLHWIFTKLYLFLGFPFHSHCQFRSSSLQARGGAVMACLRWCAQHVFWGASMYCLLFQRQTSFQKVPFIVLFKVSRICHSSLLFTAPSACSAVCVFNVNLILNELILFH